MSEQPDTAEPLTQDRSERREEIKLWLEYAKLLVSVLGVVTIIIAWQQWQQSVKIAQESAKIAQESAKTATETAYQRIASEWKDHLKLVLEKPHLRPYLEERKSIRPDDQYRQAALALADLRLDTMDATLTYAALRNASNEIGGWKDTFADAFRSSSMLCDRLKERRSNYGLIVPIADRACLGPSTK